MPHPYQLLNERSGPVKEQIGPFCHLFAANSIESDQKTRHG